MPTVVPISDGSGNAVSKLTIYNGALLHCGERFLASLSEEREPRRLLDHVWDNGGIKHCLEQAQWHFAMRTVMLDYDSSIEPDFGYRRAFAKDSDWVLTSALCADEFFNVPLTRYSDEAGYWYCDVDVLYVRYVSNSTDYGQNFGMWPETFREFVEAHFASRIVKKLSGSAEREVEVLKKREVLLSKAKGRAAMAEPTRFPAQGSWTSARHGRGNRRDRTPTGGSLIG